MTSRRTTGINAELAWATAEYEARCVRYGEAVEYTTDRYGRVLVDCYGPHARALEARDRTSLPGASRAVPVDPLTE